MYHSFTKSPPDGSWELSLKREGNVFRQSWKYNMFHQNFSNWYPDLYQKWQYAGIFHPLRIFWCLKLRGQSIRFARWALRMVHLREICIFCVLLFTAIFFSKWYHCISFKLDLLFLSYKLCLLRFYSQILSRWIMWYFSNTTSCVYWIIYADYSFLATKRLKSQNYAAKQD